MDRIPNKDIEALLSATFDAIYDETYVKPSLAQSDKKGEVFAVHAEVRLLVRQRFTRAELLDNQGCDRIRMIRKKFLNTCRKELTKILK